MPVIVQMQSEVTAINKQRFLPELGKLLTFMVEEDRQTALAMYSKLFDDAQDEQQLMDLLVSPTRQAVVIARTYDARERKQKLEAADGEAATPAFMLAIDKIYQQVAPERGAAWEKHAEESEEGAPVNQFSLFPDDAHPIDDSEYVPFQIEAEAVPLTETGDELPAEPEIPAEEPAPVSEEPEEPASPEEAAFPESAPVSETPAPAPQEEPEEEAVPPFAPAAEAAPFREPALAAQPLSAADYDLAFVPETKRKTRVFLLILYILLAIPVTLLGVALLLIPTVLALALAVAVIVLGSATLAAAFSGFPKLADILIVVGASVVVLALGLLLLWLFVWFVGGAIGGLIRGMVALGRKWCIVEVPV